MEQLAFCEYCMNENQYKINDIIKTSVLKNGLINFSGKKAVCNICKNEIFVSEVCEYNLNSLNKEYRKKHNIIGIREIKKVLRKYSIDEEALSSLLNWKRNTISRYLDGDMTSNSHSEILKKISENPSYYLMILKSNKEKINPMDYNKSRQAVKELISKGNTEEKIDAVIKYILIRDEDFTQFTLQNLLYYVQAFHYVFTGKFIFEEDCEANVTGPIYNSVLKRYKRYGYEEVNMEILENDNLELEDVERNIVESIIKFYGCYSGKVLGQMTKYEAPWILSRSEIQSRNDFGYENSKRVIDKNLIAEYFCSVKEKYNMINLLDVQKYSVDLFNKISI